MEEDNNERMEDAILDLYCHEAPLVSTPPSSMIPSGSWYAGVVGDRHHQQAVRDLLDDDDDESSLLMAEYMTRQRCYAPSRGYFDHLRLSEASFSLSYARAKGVHYIVYAFGRFGLAASTAFNAANYLDRFLSINCHLQRWETWMVELVSLACLSIACKLDEVNVPSLHHLQMEEVMSHSFRPATIREMELTLLKALQWRMACVTPFSFLQLLITCTVTAAAASRCTRLLIHSLSEASLLRFDPSVIASSALRCVVLQDHHQQGISGHISFLTRPECPLLVTAMKQDKDSDECFNTMKALYASMDHQMYSSDLQLSPSSVFPFGTVVNRSAVSRRLFGRSVPQVSTEDEDSITPTDTQGTN